MRKRLWFSLGVALLVYVGWATSQGVALRTQSPDDPNNQMPRLIALDIEPAYDEVGKGEYAHIVVTIRNIAAHPVVIASRADSKHPAAELFRWRVLAPGGEVVPQPEPQRLLAEYESLKPEWNQMGANGVGVRYLPTWFFAPNREILEPGERQSFYLTAPMGFPGTEMPGDYRLSLTYALEEGRASANPPSDYWVRFTDEKQAPLAIGYVRSREIVITRTN